jgi:multidrug efflux pump subunit AcrB
MPYIKTMMSFIVCIGVLCWFFLAGGGLKQELVPQSDEGRISIYFTHSYGAKLEDTVKKMDQVKTEFLNLPEIAAVQSTVGKSYGTHFTVLMKSWKQRSRSTQEVFAQLEKLFMTVRNEDLSYVGGGSSSSSPISGSSETDFGILLLRQNAATETLNQECQKVKELLVQSGVFEGDPRWSLASEGADIILKLNTHKASLLGVSPTMIATAVSMFMNMKKAGNFVKNGREYELFTVAQISNRDIHSLLSLPLPLSSQQQQQTQEAPIVTLGELITLEHSVLPSQVEKHNGVVAVTFTGKLLKSYDVGSALKKIQATVTPVLSEGYSIQPDYNTSRTLQESNESLWILLLSILFIFLILAAQFESFVDPLVILMSIPFALTGGLLALFLAGESLSVYGSIGLITLIGMITKHAILIVEFANQKKEEGFSPQDAVIEAAVMRLRAIIMTTFAMVLSVIPLIFSHGPGSEARYHIGLVLFGGMTFGTVVTLLIVPLIYVLSHRFIPREKKNIDLLLA